MYSTILLNIYFGQEFKKGGIKIWLQHLEFIASQVDTFLIFSGHSLPVKSLYKQQNISSYQAYNSYKYIHNRHNYYYKGCCHHLCDLFKINIE
jgi:hypothetical protein